MKEFAEEETVVVWRKNEDATSENGGTNKTVQLT